MCFGAAWARTARLQTKSCMEFGSAQTTTPTNKKLMDSTMTCFRKFVLSTIVFDTNPFMSNFGLGPLGASRFVLCSLFL